MLPKIIKPSVTRNQTMCSFTINNKIKMLLDIVKRYSPLEILKRCYEEIMHYCLISENQSCANSDLEALQNVLPYLQSIIYSVTFYNFILIFKRIV